MREIIYLLHILHLFTDKGFFHRFVSKFVKKSERTLPCQEVKYTNLYVKNLDTEISEEVLEEKFSQFGKIASLIISRDENGASRGFGFVNFDKAENAKSAVEALNGSQLGTMVIKYYNKIL